MFHSSKTKFVIAFFLLCAVVAAGYVVYQKKEEKKNTFENSTHRKEAETDDFSLRYTHENPFFSFAHADTIRVQKFDQEEGEVILVQETEKEDANKTPFEFQIFITPFDEEMPLTIERIQKDIPDFSSDTAQEIMIGNTKAIIFISQDAIVGGTREVWFAREGFLYQASALLAHDELFSRVMATWRFGEE